MPLTQVVVAIYIKEEKVLGMELFCIPSEAAHECNL